MLYTITENPSPFKKGESETISFNSEARPGIEFDIVIDNRLVTTPIYRIVQSPPLRQQNINVNRTVIEQNISVVNGENIEISAEYFNTFLINNISTRTLLINNGGGVNTYDDNISNIYNTTSMSITPTLLKEVLDIQLKFRVQSDTLGGDFKIEAFNGSTIDIIEQVVNIQDQYYTIKFKLVVSQDSIDNGIQFFITPEEGMTLSINDYSLLIIKG